MRLSVDRRNSYPESVGAEAVRVAGDGGPVVLIGVDASAGAATAAAIHWGKTGEGTIAWTLLEVSRPSLLETDLYSDQRNKPNSIQRKRQ